MTSEFINNMDFTPQKIGQQLASLLKDAIVSNEIVGGEKLVERELQKKFGVSRSPIREAIRDLESMGLVEIVPHKGTYVKKVTKQDIREDYAVRSPLEGLAAKEAYSIMDEKDREALANSLRGMRAATENKDPENFWKAHSRFHTIFINACGNGLLSAILRVLRIHSFRHRAVFPNSAENLRPHLAKHEKIMEYFNSPETDVDELARFVTQHVDDALVGFLANIEEQPKPTVVSID